MSGMTFMNKLLDGAEVQPISLGSLGNFIRGSGIQKADFTDSGAGCIHYGQIHTHYGTWATKTKTFINPAFASRLRKASPGDLVIATTSEDDAAVAKAVAWLGEENVSVSTDAYIYRHTINPKYVSYFFQTDLFQSQKKPYITGTKVRRISGDSLAKIIIPIPCPSNPKRSLEIQGEIVRILDTFTKLTAELTAELTARKKQYNYYRDQLLTFEDGEVEWKTLGEVALIFGRGKSRHRPRNDARLYGGSIPFIQTGDIRNASHIIINYTQTYSDFGLQQSKLWPKGTLCITIAANIAETAILGFDSCFPDSVLGFVADPEKTSSEYVEYLLASMKTQLQAQSTGSAQDNLNMGTFESIKLPFPDIEEQKRIVATLDKFEAITGEITEGLPREIELRQKQYEYYRDLLLSFPKPEEVEA